MKENKCKKFSNLLIYFLKVILNFLTLPQILTQKLHSKILKKYKDNYGSIFMFIKILSFMVFHFILLDLHLFFILFYYNLLGNIKNLLLSYSIVLLFHFMTYYNIEGLNENIHKKKIYLLLSIVENWFFFGLSIFSILYYIIFLGDTRLIESVLIKKRKSVSVLELLKFSIHLFYRIFSSLIKFLCLLIHLINPISTFRVLGLMKENKIEDLRILFISIFLTISQDIILLLIFIFNQVFIFSAYDSNKKFFNLVIQKKNSNNLLSKEIFDRIDNKTFKYFSDCHFYVYIKQTLIINPFYQNMKYLLVLFGFLINSLFIWRINKLKILHYKYFIKNKSVTYDLLLHFIDGLLETMYPFFFISNYLIICNKDIINYFETHYIENTEYKVIFHLNLFLLKLSDFFITLISILRIHTFNFYIQISREMKKKNSKIKVLFPLLIDETIYLKIQKNKRLKKNLDDFLEKIKEYYSSRGTKLLFITLASILENLIFILSLITLVNPLNIFKLTRNIIIYFINSKNNNKKSYYQINRKFNVRQLKLIISFLFDTLIFFPASILICFISPWNFYNLSIHIWKIYIISPLETIKESLDKSENHKVYDKSRATLKLPSRNIKFLSNLIHKVPKDWMLIIRVLFLHIAVYRAFLFWKDLIFLYNYKLKRAKSVSSQNITTSSIKRMSMLISSSSKNCLTFQRSESDEIEIHKLFSNSSFKSISKFQNENQGNLDTLNNHPSAFQAFRKFSVKTLKFVNDSNLKLFKYNVYRHYQHILQEIIFYPFLFLITFLTPWNLKKLSDFFKVKKIEEKYIELKKVLYVFYTDLCTFFSIIFLLLSVVKTIDTLILIYYSFRKYVLKQKQFGMYYDLYYKSDFKGQICDMTKGLVSNLIILGLIILNIFLLSRIFKMFRRIRYYLNTKIMDDIWKFKHLMKVHSNISLYSHHILNHKMISHIAEYLPPQEIIKFSSANSYFLSVLNMNNVWKNCYNNFYLKKLEQNNKHEILSYINPMVFGNYKSLCREISFYIKSTSRLESERDHLIGLQQVLMEETIESFLNIPHLILIPVKFLSIIPMKLRNYFLNNLEIFYSDSKHQTQIQNIFIKYDHQKIKEYIDFTLIDSHDYNIQVIGFICLIDIILITIEHAINKFLVMNLKILSFLVRKNLFEVKEMGGGNIHSTELPIIDKVKNMLINLNTKKEKFILLMKNIVVLFMYFLFHSILYLLPIFLSNYKTIKSMHDHFLELHNENLFFKISNKNFFIFLIHVFKNLSLYKKFNLLAGAYGINILIYLLNFFYIKKMKSVLNILNAPVPLYDIIYFFFSPTGLIKFLLINLKNIFIYTLFPQKTLKIYLTHIIRNNPNISFKKYILLRLTIIFLCLFPFLLNVLIKMSLMRIVVINLYAVFNFLILV
jgi:hypothetical protein